QGGPGDLAHLDGNLRHHLRGILVLLVRPFHPAGVKEKNPRSRDQGGRDHDSQSDAKAFHAYLFSSSRGLEDPGTGTGLPCPSGLWTASSRAPKASWACLSAPSRDVRACTRARRSPVKAVLSSSLSSMARRVACSRRSIIASVFSASPSSARAATYRSDADSTSP